MHVRRLPGGSLVQGGQYGAGWGKGIVSCVSERVRPFRWFRLVKGSFGIGILAAFRGWGH